MSGFPDLVYFPWITQLLLCMLSLSTSGITFLFSFLDPFLGLSADFSFFSAFLVSFGASVFVDFSTSSFAAAFSSVYLVENS